MEGARKKEGTTGGNQLKGRLTLNERRFSQRPKKKKVLEPGAAAQRGQPSHENYAQNHEKMKMERISDATYLQAKERWKRVAKTYGNRY